MSGRLEIDPQRLAAARFWAATHFPYLASALFATRLLPVDRPGVVAVDEAWRVFIDPELVSQWRANQLGSVLVHHVGHLLRDHAGRARSLGLGREDANRWTMAADAEINDDLTAAELSFPAPPVLPSTLGCEPGRFAEEYFGSIETGRSECDCDCDCGSGCDGTPKPWDQPAARGNVRPEAANLLHCQVAAEVLRCCRGLMPGTVPAEIRRGVAAVAGAVDYSYRRPSRRASAMPDVVMPTMKRSVPEVAVVVDTSGSMNETLLSRPLSEVDGLLRSLGLAQRRLPVLLCDAAVHPVQKVTSARQIRASRPRAG